MRVALLFVFAIGCGDDCPDFTQIQGGTFSRTADALTWTLQVASIPAELTFDQADVPTFVEEYKWGVDIDANGDGTYELQVMTNHYKVQGPERVVTDIVTASQTALWRVEGAVGTIIGGATATISDNTFTFVVLEMEDASLMGVQPSTSRFVWRTGYQYGPIGDRCEDSFD